MEVQVINLHLLNHLFYYSEVSGGKISGSVTSPFLGDLALTYALRAALGGPGEMYQHRQQPQYEEIRDWGFYCTVGRPLAYDRTGGYLQSTSLSMDGYPDQNALKGAASGPYKTIRRVQGIRLASSFQALVLSQKPMDLPPTLRVGTTKQTLLRIEGASTHPETCWLNAFTARTVFGNLDALAVQIARQPQVQYHYVLENYLLVQHVPLLAMKAVFQPIFSP